MSWTDKYWDLLDRLYWSPQYLGLKSIPQKAWTIDGDRVSIPREMTNEDGPLYRRVRSGDDYWAYVRRQEEVFNSLFDLVLAVLPGDAVAEMLNPFTGAGADLDYEMLGSKVHTRYGASRHANITTPDGFFVAPQSIVGLELKFNAKTSRDQLAKYLMLFDAEQCLSGPREHLDLIFVFNRDAEAAFEKDVGFQASACNAQPLEQLTDAVQNTYVRAYFETNRERARSTLARLKVHCIGWADLADRLSTLAAGISASGSVGDRTLKRLLDGLEAEIRQHPLSNIPGRHCRPDAGPVSV